MRFYQTATFRFLHNSVVVVTPSSNVAFNRQVHIKIIDDPDQAWLLLLVRLVDRD